MEEKRRAMSNEILEKITAAIKSNSIVLPTMPRMIAQINRALDDENVSLASVAELIQRDASITSRLLQISNSPLLRGRNRIDSVKTAIQRLGLNMVKNIVLTMSLRDQFNSPNAALNALLLKIFHGGVELAYTAYAFARRHRELGLNPEEVNLAGIMFNLGVLPVIHHFEKSGFETIEVVERVALELRPRLNFLILSRWDAKVELITAVSQLAPIPGAVGLGDLLLLIHAFLRGDLSGPGESEMVERVLQDLTENRAADKAEVDAIISQLQVI